MPAGTLHVSWINKGDELEHYHMMFGIDGATGTAKARSVRGRQALTSILLNDVALLPARVEKIFQELDNSGSCTMPGLNVSQEDLERLSLA